MMIGNPNLFAGNDEEKEAAARTVWVLAFEKRNAKVILENENIITTLTKISESKDYSSR